MRQNELVIVKLADLKRDSTNPNVMTKEQHAGLRKSYQKLGNLKFIIIDQDNLIVDGHQRLDELLALGETETQAIRVQVKDQAERILIRQVANKLYGEHDKKLDANDFLVLFQNQQLGELAELLAKPQEEFQRALEKHHGIEFVHEDNFDIDSALKEPPITKMGDVWQLGRHKLMCGDARKTLDIDVLMDGKSPNLLLTDPPYNIGFDYNAFEDKKSDDEYERLCKSTAYFRCNKIITPGPRNVGLWHSIEVPTDIGIWVKENSTSGATCFHLRLCEPILFYGKFRNKRNTDTFHYNMSIKSELTAARAGQQLDKEHHAPTKPMHLWTELLRSFSEPNDIVTDVFSGNGTTIIACEQTGRTAYCLEIDERYCTVIIHRWEALTGQKAVLLSNSQESSHAQNPNAQ